MKTSIFLTILFLFIGQYLLSQNISGRIVDESGVAVDFATVSIENTSSGTVSSEDGSFVLKAQSFPVLLHIRCVGYQEKKLLINQGDEISDLIITLSKSSEQIVEVAVTAISKKEQISRTGFTTGVLETKSLQSSPTTINQALKTMPGLNIRVSGGVGSNFSLSLNGLTGNQVRYFMDGIPVDNLGSVFNLNNFSVNMVENVLVYKGVVPITLGADALGGAINIVTPVSDRNYLDASYSFGSFNTHLFSVSGNHYNEMSGFFVKGQAYYNFSENNYQMYDVPLVDDLGNVKDDIEARRFNDRYKAAFVLAEAGFRNQSYADLISLMLTAGASNKQYQHSDFSINNVFGKLHGKDESYTATLKYIKTLGQLGLNGFLMAGKTHAATIDTSSYRYNWLGNIISETGMQGELFGNKTLFKVYDEILQARLNANYNLKGNGSFDLSYAYQYIRKKGEDEVDEYNLTFSKPNSINKNTIGLSYLYKPVAVPLELSVFAKEYLFRGHVVYYQNTGNQIEELKEQASFSQLGYGATLAWFVNNYLTFKTSFEKAYRTPESYEILGDGRYVLPNPQLRPESSNNLNAGLHFNQFKNKKTWTGDVNFFFRDSRQFIRLKSTGNPFGTYENLNNVRSIGFEAGGSVNIDRKWLLSGNVTYQHISDQTKEMDGKPNDNFNQRVPNTPYLFGNAGLSYVLDLNEEGNRLTFRYSTRYVHEFSLTFEHLGDKDSKNIIPAQLIQDVTVDYAMGKRYRVSLNVFNVANELAYDNFKVQKPGRNLYVKFIYQLK